MDALICFENLGLSILTMRVIPYHNFHHPTHFLVIILRLK